MIAYGLPAARPIPFPKDATPVDRIRWLQRETVLTAALAEQRGNLNVKMKAIHEIERLIWLELRASKQGDNDPSDCMQQYLEYLKREEQRAAETHTAREAHESETGNA
jgi:hypothetical protein